MKILFVNEEKFHRLMYVDSIENNIHYQKDIAARNRLERLKNQSRLI